MAVSKYMEKFTYSVRMDSSFGKNVKPKKYSREQKLSYVFVKFDFAFTRVPELVKGIISSYCFFLCWCNYMHSKSILRSEITHWKDKVE